MDITKIKQLQSGTSYIVPESDYGKAEIWFIHGFYFLFEIPMYGGEPNFVQSIPKHRVGEIPGIVDSWT